jgi:hypothetical protein
VNPASVLSIADDPSLFENAQMEGKPRLRGVEGIGQFAHAPFSASEQLDDLEPRLVGEGVEELDGALGSRRCGNWHGQEYIKKSCCVKRGYQHEILTDDSEVQNAGCDPSVAQLAVVSLTTH